MDVKAPLTYPDYERVTGMHINVDDVRRSMGMVRASGLPYEFRITVVPGMVGAEELRRMEPDLRGARRVALQNFRPEHCLDRALCEVDALQRRRDGRLSPASCARTCRLHCARPRPRRSRPQPGGVKPTALLVLRRPLLVRPRPAAGRGG